MKQLGSAWNRFFYEEVDLTICGIMRVAFSSLLLVNIILWAPDLNVWFGEHGAVDLSSSRLLIDPDTWTIFQFLPRESWVLWFCYGLLLVHTTGLLTGFHSRVQAAGVFFWLAMFQHRNLIIFDGEDYLFRMLAFLFIFLPAGEFLSLDRKRGIARGSATGPVWPLRLVQIQMTLIYVSTAIEKLKSEDWLNGSAIYYVSRLDDVFGRFPVPDLVFESMSTMRIMTWCVLALEVAIPVGLWIKRTRLSALIAAALLHLSIDYAMNLFLFEWIMIVGLLSFARKEDVQHFRLNKKSTGRPDGEW